MASFVVPCDMDITLQFYLHDKRTTLVLPLLQGENAEDVLRGVFLLESVPTYLHVPLLHSLHRALVEKRRERDETTPTPHAAVDVMERVRALAQQYVREHEKFRAFDDTPDDDGSDVDADAKGAISTPLPPPRGVEVSTFSLAYRALCLMSKSTRDTLFRLEHEYHQASTRMDTQRTAELDALRTVQLAEMEQVMNESGHSGEYVGELVQKHVEQLEDVEKEWQGRVHDVKTTQIADFAEFVVSLYELEVEQANRNDEELWLLEEAETSEESSDEDGEGTGASAATPPQPTPNTRTRYARQLQLSSLLHRGVRLFGGGAATPADAMPPPTHHAPRPESAQRSVTRVSIGSQRSRTYELAVRSGTTTAPCRPQPGAAQEREDAMRHLYSDAVCALVMPAAAGVEPSGVWESERELIALCDASTELHFDNVRVQLGKVRGALEEARRTLHTGDMYVTKHSNLHQVHLVFHVAAEAQHAGACPLDAAHPLVAGLGHALRASTHFDVATLFLPVLMLDHAMPNVSRELARNRIEHTLKAVRSLLMDLRSTEHALRRVELLVPDDVPGVRETTMRAIHELFTTDAEWSGRA